MFDYISQSFSSLFSRLKGERVLSEPLIQEVLIKIHESLIASDVSYELAQEFIQQLKQQLVGQKIGSNKLNPAEYVVTEVKKVMLSFLGGSGTPFHSDIPSVILFMGLQGSGKTTTAAKLAYYLQTQAARRDKKRKILLASVDFNRPAAIEQLKILAGQIGCDFYSSTKNDAVAATQEIYTYFKQNNYDLLFLDTAGRMHVDEQLLKELQEIESIVHAKNKILVLDSMIGQQSLVVAQEFESRVGFTGAILTKIDSDAKGGSAFSFYATLKKPIYFLGVGEKIEDFDPYHAERVVSRILGMGDMQTLIEKAEEKIKAEEQDRLYQAISRGELTLDDFAQQMDMVKRMGSLAGLTKYLPMGGVKLSDSDLERAERDLIKFRAILSSMTAKERKLPQILDSSRKQRIARGAGVVVADINAFLDKFKQSKEFIKIMKKMGGKNLFFK